jgi:hypothetical protein
MGAYGSEATSNSGLQAVTPDGTVPVTLFKAETPAAGAASLACAIMPRSNPGSQLNPIAIRCSCPLGLGAGVFQIQDADFYSPTDGGVDFDSISFGGASPGQIVAENLNASGVGRVELIIRGRFLRILCVTAPSNPVTFTVE